MVLADKYTKVSILSGFMKLFKGVHVYMVDIPMLKGVGDTLTSAKNKGPLRTIEDSCGELGLYSLKQIVSLLTNPSFGHFFLNNQLLHLLLCNKPSADEKAYHYFPGKIYSISHNTDLSKSIHETSV